MNNLENLKKQWRDNTEKAIETIDDLLHHHEDYEEAKDFRKLANWLATTPINHYAFLSHTDAYAIDNAINFASLLKNIHHALLDDGEITFVSVKDYTTFIVFADPYEDYFQTLLEKHLADLNRNLKVGYDSTVRLLAMAPNEESKARIETILKNKPQSVKDLTITTHRNVDQFINEVETLDRLFNERAAKLEEKMKVLRSKKM